MKFFVFVCFFLDRVKDELKKNNLFVNYVTSYYTHKMLRYLDRLSKQLNELYCMSLKTLYKLSHVPKNEQIKNS